MGDTVILAICFPLIIVGMVLVSGGAWASWSLIVTGTAKRRASAFIQVKFARTDIADGAGQEEQERTCTRLPQLRWL